MSVRVVSVIGKFFGLPWHDRFLLLEAILLLAFASFAIAWLPFRHAGFLAARPIRRPKAVCQTRMNKVQRIRWAIITTAARVPWRALCFQQCLAAQLMLRRRGIPSVLYYGAAKAERKGLSAHVWVRDGEVDVIGSEIAHRFRILATFPPQSADMLTESYQRVRLCGD
jgi:Transglutaminase-like superfamily